MAHPVCRRTQGELAELHTNLTGEKWDDIFVKSDKDIPQSLQDIGVSYQVRCRECGETIGEHFTEAEQQSLPRLRQKAASVVSRQSTSQLSSASSLPSANASDHCGTEYTGDRKRCESSKPFFEAVYHVSPPSGSYDCGVRPEISERLEPLLTLNFGYKTEWRSVEGETLVVLTFQCHRSESEFVRSVVDKIPRAKYVSSRMIPSRAMGGRHT